MDVLVYDYPAMLENRYMRKHTFTIHCEWDEEASVWYVADSDVPGLAAEAPTAEAMQAVLIERVPELLRENAPNFEPCTQVPFELLLKRSGSVRLPC